MTAPGWAQARDAGAQKYTKESNVCVCAIDAACRECWIPPDPNLKEACRKQDPMSTCKHFPGVTLVKRSIVGPVSSQQQDILELLPEASHRPGRGRLLLGHALQPSHGDVVHHLLPIGPLNHHRDMLQLHCG